MGSLRRVVRILRGMKNPYTSKFYFVSVFHGGLDGGVPIPGKLSIGNNFYRKMKVHRRTDFFGRECSDLGVGGWVSCNLMQLCATCFARV